MALTKAQKAELEAIKSVMRIETWVQQVGSVDREFVVVGGIRQFFWYDENRLVPVCNKCGGTGQHWARHIESGVCFKCYGAGVTDNAVAITLSAAITRVYNWWKKDMKRRDDEAAKDVERAARQAEREARWAAERAERAAASRYAAAEGEKVTVEGEIVLRKTIEFMYGTSCLIIVDCGEGIRVKTFTTASWAWEATDIEEHPNTAEAYKAHKGARVRITGTVKKNEEYQEEKSSLLTRCKTEFLVTV